MLPMDTLKARSRDLLDPSWAGTLLTPRRRPRGPLTNADYHEALAVMRELAEHTANVPDAGWRWWCELLTWRDHKDDPVDIGGVRRLVLFTTVARDAAVSSSAIAAGRLRPDEAQRVAAVITMERDSVYAPLFTMAGALARATRDAMAEARHEALAMVPPERLAEIDADAAMCDLVAGPLTPLVTDTVRGGVAAMGLDASDPRVLAAHAYNPIPPRPYQCPRCQHIWVPRVPEPRKCPVCQVQLRWEPVPV